MLNSWQCFGENVRDHRICVDVFYMDGLISHSLSDEMMSVVDVFRSGMILWILR